VIPVLDTEGSCVHGLHWTVWVHVLLLGKLGATSKDIVNEFVATIEVKNIVL